MDLIQKFGDSDRISLESAFHEFEDPDGGSIRRLGAKQKLKAFLLQLGGKVEDAALVALEKYLEMKVLGK